MRRSIVEPDHPQLSVGQQCKLLSIARSSFYYTPKGETEQNLGLMRLIDEQFLEPPFYGVRQMTWHLRNDGHLVNEKQIRRLMRLMGLMPIYQKPNTSRPAKGHKTNTYLLKGLKVKRPNQVWCPDITYLPMRRGFLYLVAIMDWHPRKVLAWRISNTLEAAFCVKALNEAIHKFGPPEIMDTDQGSQFPSFAWTDRLRRTGVPISMDGKGRFLDSIIIERLWRTLKYECEPDRVYHFNPPNLERKHSASHTMTAERTKEPGAQDEPQRNQILTMAIRERCGTLTLFSLIMPSRHIRDFQR